jgi:exopolysaccharide production protein ExoQ
MASHVGRDPSLTDRTVIWNTALNMHTNRFIGTGYESFWLGPRILDFWQRSSIHGLNEVHNGYLEVYLSLGLVGVFLLGIFLLASYRAIWKKFRHSSSLASLGLAFWIITLFYNMTEAAALKGNLLWLTLLAVSIAVPEHAADPARSVPAIESVGTTARVLLPRLEPASQRR